MSDIKISELPDAMELSGAELIPLVQDGETRKTTADQLPGANGSKIKISDLPDAEPLTGSELIPVVQDDETRKTTSGDLLSGLDERLSILENAGAADGLPVANTAFVNTQGNDSSAEVGSRGKCFATALAAYNALATLASANPTQIYWLHIGEGNFAMNFTAADPIYDSDAYIYSGTPGAWLPNIHVVGSSPDVSKLTINVVSNPSSNFWIPSLTINSDKSVLISITGGSYTNDQNYGPYFSAPVYKLTGCMLGSVYGPSTYLYDSYSASSNPQLIIDDCIQLTGSIEMWEYGIFSITITNSKLKDINSIANDSSNSSGQIRITNSTVGAVNFGYYSTSSSLIANDSVIGDIVKDCNVSATNCIFHNASLAQESSYNYSTQSFTNCRIEGNFLIGSYYGSSQYQITFNRCDIFPTNTSYYYGTDIVLTIIDSRYNKIFANNFASLAVSNSIINHYTGLGSKAGILKTNAAPSLNLDVLNHSATAGLVTLTGSSSSPVQRIDTSSREGTFTIPIIFRAESNDITFKDYANGSSENLMIGGSGMMTISPADLAIAFPIFQRESDNSWNYRTFFRMVKISAEGQGFYVANSTATGASPTVSIPAEVKRAQLYWQLNTANATGTVTINLDNMPVATSSILEVASGDNPVNLIFPSGTKQAGGGGATFVPTAANAVDVITIIKLTASSYRINVAKNYA